eukprot:Skav206999  [mRNA]  locus=scaffold1299:58819:63618:- [translate_table: standard]
MEALHLKEAHEIIALLKAGSVSPLELIDVVEQRIRATDSVVHATPITCFERAREKARQLETAKSSTSRGFLYGLPDTHAVEAVRFTEGSLLHAERIAEKNDPLVDQLESKGAIVVGKTNVPEFCAGNQTFNSVFPTTVSPWDVRTTSGGSSGGTVARWVSKCWLPTALTPRCCVPLQRWSNASRCPKASPSRAVARRSSEPRGPGEAKGREGEEKREGEEEGGEEGGEERDEGREEKEEGMKRRMRGKEEGEEEETKYEKT